ncbi:MAG: hypothetical protein HKK67_05900 [Chlorobiaceae bacterium]|nr:hypothetical protein [Chlorobiaceae bacterium]
MKKTFLQLAGIVGIAVMVLTAFNTDAQASRRHHHHHHHHHYYHRR